MMAIGMQARKYKMPFASEILESPAENADLRKGDECDQQAIDALCAGEQLQNQDFTEFGWVLRHNARGRPHLRGPTPTAEPAPANSAARTAPSKASTTPMLSMIIFPP